MSRNPFEQFSSMDMFQHMYIENAKYLLQLFKTADFTRIEMIKQLENIVEDPKNHFLLNAYLMKDSQVKDKKLSHAVGKLTAKARKILYNEKLNNKTYEYARRNYAEAIQILFNEAGYTNQEQLYTSYASRTVNLLEKLIFTKKQRSESLPLGTPKIDTEK